LPHPPSIMNIVSIPRHVAGHVIGKRGQRILQIQEQTGTRIRSENVDDLCNFHLEAETQEHLNHAKTLINEIVNSVETRNHREKPPLSFVIIDYPEDACDNTAGAILRLHFQPIPECPAILTVQRQILLLHPDRHPALPRYCRPRDRKAHMQAATGDAKFARGQATVQSSRPDQGVTPHCRRLGDVQEENWGTLQDHVSKWG
ncbi:hypothetical protein BC938DRAFT_478308, partial [Jimgerdemannia flammicorona]